MFPFPPRGSLHTYSAWALGYKPNPRPARSAPCRRPLPVLWTDLTVAPGMCADPEAFALAVKIFADRYRCCFPSLTGKDGRNSSDPDVVNI